MLNWGESTYIPNGINVINPVDLSKLRLPGSELREGLSPVGMAAVTAYPSDSLSIEGFVQLDWEPIKIDPSGTYFSATDYVGAGGDHLFVELPGAITSEIGLSAQSRYGIEGLVGAIQADLQIPITANDLTASQQQTFPDPDFMKMQRSADREPGSKGQYGLAARLFAERLNDTEFGVYFVRYHNRLPIVSAQSAPGTSLKEGLVVERAVTRPASTTYTALQGAITTQVELAIQAGRLPAFASETEKTAYIDGQAADQVDGVGRLLAIERYVTGSRYFLEYPKDQSLFGLSFNTQLGSTGWALQGEMSFRPDVPLQRAERKVLEEGLVPILTALGIDDASSDEAAADAYVAAYEPYVVNGSVERSVSQVQATATKSFGPMMGSDGMIFLAELAVLHVHDMPDPSVTPIESPATGDARDYQDADANSFGYRLAARMDYNSAIGAVNLFPYAQYQHDFRGNSPSPIGPFIEGRKGLTLGVKADYLSEWEFDAGVSFMWGDTYDLRDRDFFYSSIKYSF